MHEYISMYVQNSLTQSLVLKYYFFLKTVYISYAISLANN